METTPSGTTNPEGEKGFEGTPTFDGKYMYIRGERNLYCIGEK